MLVFTLAAYWFHSLHALLVTPTGSPALTAYLLLLTKCVLTPDRAALSFEKGGTFQGYD